MSSLFDLLAPISSILPLLVIAFFGLVLMVVEAIWRGDQVDHRSEPAMWTWLILLMGLVAGVFLFVNGPTGPVPEAVRSYLAADRMAYFFDIVICGGALLSALLAGGYLKEHELERGEFYTLLLFSAFGAMVLARAVDLLSLFIGLETMSLGVYALVGFRRTSARSAEGAVKYFLLGSFAAALLLFGSAFLYGATGTTNLSGIGASIAAGEADVKLVLLGMLLVLVGLAFKVSAVPFHMWTPDAYEGAVTPATTFMAVAVKAAAFASLLRVLVTSFSDELSASAATGWPPVVAGLAAFTMVFGNLAAVGQTSVKRMLAYSSIAHAGYALVGVCATFRVAEAGVSSVLYYLLAYTVGNALAFGALIAYGSRGKEAVTFEDLAGAGRRHPLVALPFVLGMLSLLGMPPTAGFFGKYYVFTAAVQAGGGMVWLAVIGVLTSAVGAYYYIKVLVYLFMKEPQAGAPKAVPMRSGYVAVALVLAGYFVLKMGLTPGTYLDMALDAARQLAS